MRFEVPQFIEIEDKIFGPLTWRQLLYLGGGIGIAVVLFLTGGLSLGFIFIGLPIAILGLALAFLQVNNRPFSYFLEAIVNYFRGQRLYLWKRKENTVYKYNADNESADPQYASPTKISRRPQKDISSLARKLELQALQKPE
jgi:hypothetical protein